jgi:hypothetical protein
MPGRGGFDPCREWLGIAAVELTDPFRALGVPADVADPQVVLAAAEKRLARLRGVDPGPFKLARDALLRRIEACRDEVLAAVSARPPLAAPPPPAGFAPPTPPAVTAIDPIESAPDPAPDDGFEVIRIDRSRRVRPATPSPLPAILSLLVLAAVGMALYTIWPRLPMRHQFESIADVFTDGPEDPPPAASPSDAGVPSVDPPVPSPGDLAAGGVATPAVPPPDRPSPPAEDPATHTAPPVMPAPPPVTDPEDVAQGADGVEQPLRAAYDAIRRNAFDEADEQVAAARRLVAADDALARRVQRWEQFARLAREAAVYRERALDAANSGGEYDVNGKLIAVVESTPQRFVYRMAGRNVAISPRDKVPGPVVTTILRTWFASRNLPKNHVLLGVHLVARVDPNLRRAADAWAVAGRGGEDVSLLEPLLDDPIVTAVAKNGAKK